METPCGLCSACVRCRGDERNKRGCTVCSWSQSDVMRVAGGKAALVLRFEGQRKDEDGPPVGTSRQKTMFDGLDPARSGGLDTGVMQLLTEAQTAVAAAQDHDSSVASEDDFPANFRRTLTSRDPHVDWEMRTALINVRKGGQLGVLYNRKRQGPLFVSQVSGAAKAAGMPVGAMLVRVDGQETRRGVEAELAVQEWRERHRHSGRPCDTIAIQYLSPSAPAFIPEAVPDIHDQSLGGMHHQTVAALFEELERDAAENQGDSREARGYVVHVKVAVRPGEELGVLYERLETGPLWCRKIFGPCATAGVPEGAVLIAIDNVEVPDGAAAEAAVAAWRRKGLREVDIAFIQPPSFSSPDDLPLDRSVSLGLVKALPGDEPLSSGAVAAALDDIAGHGHATPPMEGILPARRTVRIHVIGDEELGVMYEQHAQGPLYCRSVFGACERAGLPEGAVLLSLDGTPVPDGAAAEAAVAAWRRRGASSMDIEYAIAELPSPHPAPAPGIHLMELSLGSLAKSP
eukprot:Hpha_TRINITY_DN8972_c0_g1::TRINITY_DN8972_c0_g1_i1::g.80739::m.80739